MMATVKKFGFSGVINQIRHIEREMQESSNPDIDPGKSGMNYSLTPDRGMSAYSYFRQRISDPEVYLYKNKELKPLCGWIVTAPEDIPPDKEEKFFKECFDFLNKRYGEENCIQAVVHRDESGKAHMHYLFVPIVKRKKMSANHKEKYKVCANEIINRRELRDFHPALNKYLKEHGLPRSVYTGVTARQGGNRSVKDMKAERDIERTRQTERRTITW